MDSRLRRILSGRFVALYVGWLVAPLPFLIPVLAAQAVLFGRDPELWLRGSLPHRGLLPLIADNVATWVAAYGAAWAVLLALRRWGKFVAPFPSPGFLAVEALRSVGGLAVLAAYEFAVIEGHYAGVLPGLDVPASAADAAAGMPSLWGLLWPWMFVTSQYGDLHFYAQHHLLHASTTLYNWVHKVHHRSHNTNPFSGLSMHPVEHIVYMSGLPLLPPLAALCGVTVPYWVIRSFAVSLIIYPIPGHIGTAPFERWHWLHHTKFNWNFGSSPLFDILFGTDYESYKAAAGKAATDRTRANVVASAAAAQAAAVGTVVSAP